MPHPVIGEKIARRLRLPGCTEKKERGGGETKSSTYRRSISAAERSRELAGTMRSSLSLPQGCYGTTKEA
jgi:hypothetical protein